MSDVASGVWKLFLMILNYYDASIKAIWSFSWISLNNNLTQI